jgi:nucleoside-diphosphate-sugar epimerase
MEAYWVSKALSRITSHIFLETYNPKFEIINLLPTVVIGPDALATSTASLLTGTRALAMAPILGQKIDMPLLGVSVHVDDVAQAHIDALKPSVPGNADYVLTSDGPEGIVWDDAKEMVKAIKGAGMLKLDGNIQTMKWKVNAGTTDKAFGWKCKSFEVTMKDLVGQYLELLGHERAVTGECT